MYPSEWAGKTIEVLAHHHPVVWVEDPYNLLEPDEVERLSKRLLIAGHSVLAVSNAFDLRAGLLPHLTTTSRLVVIDQSYTLRDPHLLPKDAKPADLVPLAAPDWKPFIPKDAVFRPTVREFLGTVTEDTRWPAEVNIYPYEELARHDPDKFVRAYESFKQAGRVLTSEDLVVVGASTVFGVNLADLSDPTVALQVAFHSRERWDEVSRFFNRDEVEVITKRLRSLPAPVGDLFGDKAAAARLALTALLVLRQHFEEPGIHLPVLDANLSAWVGAVVAPVPQPPSWFTEQEVPEFERLLSPTFAKYLSTTLRLQEPASAEEFARRERMSPRLRALALAGTDLAASPPQGTRQAPEFDLITLVPELRSRKRELESVAKAVEGKVERLRLTPLKQRALKQVLEIFDGAGASRIDGLVGRLAGLAEDIEGPARRQWEAIAGFGERWVTEGRECRDLLRKATALRDDLDYQFGALLEARYAEEVPRTAPTTRAFYENFMLPRRRLGGGGTSKALVLVIDSMRFDLWKELVRPELEADYDVEEILGLSELPSETRVSRSCFFAGKAPGQLPQTIRETELFGELLSRLHGTACRLDDVPSKRPGLRYLARAQDGLTLAGVFDFADVLSHGIDWNPHTIYNALRPLIKEIRAVLQTEGPETTVFITADHGHYFQAASQPVYLQGAEDVGYRSALLRGRVEGGDAQHLFQIPGTVLGHVAPGIVVFPRPGFHLRSKDADQGRGRPSARYRHGGLSLAEVVVPVARLRHRSAPTRINLSLALRGKAQVGEEAFIEVSVSSDGIVHSPVRLIPTENVEGTILTGVSSQPSVERLRFTPASPGRTRLEVVAMLGEQAVGRQALDVDVAAAAAPEDEAKAKLRKLFGDD